MTPLEPLQQIGRNRVRWRGREFIYFSGCDYFRMATHPAVLKAVSDGLEKFGLNVAASRVTTGHHKIYEVLEEQLADFFEAEDALLVSTGYLTSIFVAQALAGNFSHALIDERAHPALLDAANHLDCPMLKFKHRDADDFARAVGRCGKGARPIVLTDGMFSHDGSVAPLKAWLKLLPGDGMILVDDAHGAGVLGRNGRGTPEHENVSRRQIVQCITLSKAFGVYGGAILGTPGLRERIFDYSRAFVGSTPVPLPLANAALQSLKILKTRGTRLRRKLNENAAYAKSALWDAGFEIPALPGPIIPIHAQSVHESLALKKHLLAAGIFPPFLKYPGGDANGYFRFVISNQHTRADLDRMVNALKSF
ncbi:MAG TPA: aminotransferase class I/II-fold pyridoxal phosphate-dependent enzyme [Candidatus Acidoferrales bacterium]|nr:aminotransferase class I/II-fold pyridoxal phosphate-dependent enzyme [Candidatus Acidoferrales bacterium]